MTRGANIWAAFEEVFDRSQPFEIYQFVHEVIQQSKNLIEISRHSKTMMDLYTHSKKMEKSPRTLGYCLVYGLANASLGRVAQAGLALDAMKAQGASALSCVEKLAEEISKKSSRDLGFSSHEKLEKKSPESVSKIPRTQPIEPQSELFSRMSVEEIKAFLKMARVRRVNAGDTVFLEAENSNSLLIVAEGELELRSSSGLKCKYQEGDFFGEIALLGSCKRTGTVTAVRDCDLLEYSRDQVIQSFIEFPGLESRLAEFFHLRLFLNLSLNHPFFKSYSEDRRKDFFYLCHSSRLAPKTLVIEEGKPSSKFFFLLDGEAEVFQDSKKIGLLSKGEFFGESGILGISERSASVLTSTACDLLDCPQYLYTGLLERFPELKAYLEQNIKRRESLGSK